MYNGLHNRALCKWALSQHTQLHGAVEVMQPRLARLAEIEKVDINVDSLTYIVFFFCFLFDFPSLSKLERHV